MKPGDRIPSTLSEQERQTLDDEIRSLRHQLQEAKQEIDRLTHLAGVDSLTGVANRRQFDEELIRRIAALHRFEHRFCLLFVDVDHFKPINDQQGHHQGDRVLKMIGQALAGQLRQVDFVARLGGDEFVIILSADDAEQTLAATQRIREEVVPFVNKQLQDHTISFSIGVAVAQSGCQADQLLRQADAAMYQAKRAGGDQAVVFSAPQ